MNITTVRVPLPGPEPRPKQKPEEEPEGPSKRRKTGSRTGKGAPTVAQVEELC